MNSTNLNDITPNLSTEEQIYLSNINKKSNEIRKEISSKKDFFNLSLNEILNNWSNSHNEIINELSSISYSNKWDLNRIDLWWNNLFQLFDKLLSSVVKNDRLIYVGITLIILSLLIYLINITS